MSHTEELVRASTGQALASKLATGVGAKSTRQSNLSFDYDKGFKVKLSYDLTSVTECVGKS